ncbi:MAG: SPFH domain-containing protein [Candidatus Hodarchaeales archaeon]|jgi:regulator of protease activity HflC (stomatin/prohibitin superfamily)
MEIMNFFAQSEGLDVMLMFFGLFGLILVLIYLASGIKIIKEWERAPVLRLGRYTGLKGPGVFWIIPGIDKIPSVISTRIQTYSFRSEQSLTRDNVPVTIDAVLFFKVVDVEKTILEVEHYQSATQWVAQTTLREVTGQVELDEVLAEREKIAHHMQEIVDEKTVMWGIKIMSVEIRDVVVPGRLQEAISRQAEAERERRARITLAQAEKEAAKGMIEAAEQYAKVPLAMELRWINLLFEAATEGGATIMLIPTNIPVAGFSGTTGNLGRSNPDGSLPPVGYFGMKELPKPEKKKDTEE